MDKKLVAYITSCYPNCDFTVDLAEALSKSGVDMLELGVPFSDPVADGPVIEAANLKSLEAGFKMKNLFEISGEISKHVDTLWMGYYNSFYKQGIDNITAKAKELGLSGFIIPDLPHEEALLVKDSFTKNNQSLISFVAPTDSKERIETLTKDAKKFIYMVAYAGITGAGHKEDLSETIGNVRESTDTPLFIGFGVNEKTAKEKSKGVDGVIVGSAFVNILNDDSKTFSTKIDECCQIATNIKESIN